MINELYPLVRLALDGNFKALEESWIQAVTSGQRDLENFFEAADRTVASGRADVAGPLLGMLLESLHREPSHDGLLNFAERCVLLCITDKSVRTHASAIHTKGRRPELPALVAPLDGSNSETVRDRVAKCLRLKPGTFVSSAARFAPERVVRFDTEALLFWLSDSESERHLTPEQAAHDLSILAHDDFRALLRFEVQRLIELSDKDPAVLVMSALKAHKNRLEWQGLKKLMARGVVDPTNFARWWNKAKGQIERNPMIQVYGDRQPILILRETAISHEDEMIQKLKMARNEIEKFDLALDYLASLTQGHAKDEVFLTHCAEVLAQIAESPATNSAIAITAASIFDDVKKLVPEFQRAIDATTLTARAQDLGDLVSVLGSEDHCRRTLEFVRANCPDRWPQIFAKNLPTAPGRLTDMIAKELLAAQRGEELASAISTILASPDRFGEGLLWLWKAATSKALDQAPCRIDKIAITLALLRTMNRWARAAKSQVSTAQKSLLTRMRSAVVASNYKTVLAVFEQVNDGQAVQLHHAIKDNMGLTDAQRHKLAEELKHDHKDAIVGKRELWQDECLYTSARGLRIRQDEFNKIVNTDMLNNSAAIGEAAAFGDLSENAEFTAALEKRDFLAARANDIGDELKKAVLIPEDVPLDRVNVGQRIRVRNVNNNTEEDISFLGPWDANLEQRIYSYQAPFARNFLGKKVGEIVIDGDHKVEIVKIDRAIIPD